MVLKLEFIIAQIPSIQSFVVIEERTQVELFGRQLLQRDHACWTFETREGAKDPSCTQTTSAVS